MTKTSDGGIHVMRCGFMALVQDQGRFGFQELGVSVSGAADKEALDVGNILVGNPPGSAALEVMLGDFEIEFIESMMFALTGAETDARLDDVSVGRYLSYKAHAGSRLSLSNVRQGLRAYISVQGGVDTPKILGSRSTHIASAIGGFKGRGLQPGDVLMVGKPEPGDEYVSRCWDGDELPADELTVRVVLGPQDDEFSESGIQTFLSSTYVVSDQSNRQGLRLEGSAIESLNGRYDIVSDAVVNGSIQVPGDGKPIILLSDRQTTGGYLKIATVASVDIPRLGQASPGNRITFSAVSVEESQQLFIERQDKLLTSINEPVGDQIFLRVDDTDISVGMAVSGSAEAVVLDGIAYPIVVDEFTPDE